MEYIQGQINKIRNSEEDRQSRIVWQTVNELSKRKRTYRAKLNAASQVEPIHTWKEHFKNLLGKSPKVTDKLITKIIINQLDIKLKRLLKKNSTEHQEKIKNRKAVGLDEIPPEIWKTTKFDNTVLRYNQNTI